MATKTSRSVARALYRHDLTLEGIDNLNNGIVFTGQPGTEAYDDRVSAAIVLQADDRSDAKPFFRLNDRYAAGEVLPPFGRRYSGRRGLNVVSGLTWRQ